MGHVTISNINKFYKKRVHALKNINVDIKKGEFIVLVGPSGCGKTTLLRSIAGLEEITSGELKIGDQVVNDLPPSERDIGMVFQEYALYPHMTVRENLTFGLRMRKTEKTEIDRRVSSAAELLGLEPYLARKPAELSGGQRQRVAIGRALVKQPGVFLFDEPLSNLDAQLRAQTRIEIAALHRRLGSTSIYVTHDQVEAMTLADRIVVLEAGRVRQIGSPLELYNSPQNRFVAAFIGSPGMNFVRGELQSSQGGGRKFTHSAGTIEFAAGEAPQHNGPAVLGVRPEALKVAEGKADLAGEVIQNEPHGHETHVVVRVSPETAWIVRVPGAAKVSGNVSLAIDRKAVHWFDTSTEGNRLTVS